jgi:hypothetical protein
LWPYQATVRLHTPADSPAARRCATYGRIEPVDKHTCLLHFGADTPHALAFLLGVLEVDFDVRDAPELAEQLLRTADRYRRAVEPAGG